MEMCSLEFINLQPAAWTSKLQAIAVIICMMFYYSRAALRDASSAGNDGDAIRHKQVFTLTLTTTNTRLKHTIQGIRKLWKMVIAISKSQHMDMKAALFNRAAQHEQ